MTDKAIRMNKTPGQPEATVAVKEMWITQGDVDGLHDFLMWAEGFVRGNPGTIPGHFETVMFYRKLKTYINEAQSETKSLG